jgi:hypothetical protein
VNLLCILVLNSVTLPIPSLSPRSALCLGSKTVVILILVGPHVVKVKPATLYSCD